MPIQSGLSSASGRMLAELTNLTDVRPEPARGITVNSRNWVAWEPPPPGTVFTHYRLRIDHDDGDPDIEVPKGNRGMHLFYGARVFLSVYNQPADMESSQISLEYDFEAATLGSGGGCSECSGKSDVRVETMTLDASPDTVPNTSFTPCTGDQLLWKLIQDSTGGRTVAWDTQYENGPTADIDGTPETYTLVRFVGINSKWAFDGNIITGLSS